jgi:hypothetical protein
VKRFAPVLIPLAGLGVFWLLTESHVPHGLTWGILIGCTCGGLVAAIVGAFLGATRPLLTAVLLCGWALFIVVGGVIIATLFCYLALKIGDHIGGPDNATSKAIAAGLGVTVGALAKIVYDAVPQIGYSSITSWIIHFRYEDEFPNETGNMDAGFLAGWAAIKYPGGGSIPFPATWQLADSRPDPENAALQTLVIKGWTVTAVRRRLILIKKAVVSSSGNVTIVGKTDARNIEKLADLISAISPTLQLGTDLQTDLESRVAELRAAANTPAASDPAAQRANLRKALDRVLILTPPSAHSSSTRPSASPPQATAAQSASGTQ